MACNKSLFQLINAEKAGYELVIVYNDQDDRLIPMNGKFLIVQNLNQVNEVSGQILSVKHCILHAVVIDLNIASEYENTGWLVSSKLVTK